MPVRCSYVICSTPRSGSTMLCELLKSTNVAGRPEEFFEARAETGVPPHPGDFLNGLPRTGTGIRDDDRPPYAPPYSDLRGIRDYRRHLARSFELGTTANGVFGTKLMWTQIAELQQLTSSIPQLAGLEPGALLERMFLGPAYVWMRRRDRVRQAISFWRALQTRIWRGDHRHGEEPVIHYRFEGIAHLVKALEADDEAWAAHFARHGIAPLTISYEDDLVPGPTATVRRVLHHIGLDLPDGWTAAERTERQADEVNDAWLAAYHRDAAR